MSTEITNRERDIIRIIRESVERDGFVPSQREIAAGCGLSSPASTNANLRVLAAKGLITMRPGNPRAITITAAGMVALTEGV